MKTTFDFLERRWLPILLVIAALPRLGLACFEHGVNHPDEVFQMLEPAHRWVYGYGIQSWEFQDGARSWLLPGIVALLWKGLVFLGLSDPLTLVPLLRVPFVASAVCSAYLAARLAEALSGRAASFGACLFSAFMPLALILDFRTTTEAASAPILLLAMLSAVGGRFVRAGAFAALLVFLRPVNGIVIAAMVGWLVFERNSRALLRVVSGAVPVSLAGGAIDWITWGSPFHHLVEYLRFNWVESGASLFGTQPFWTYGVVLWRTALPLVLGLPAAAFVLWRRVPAARMPLMVTLLYIVLHSIVAHKEPRFLLPILPLIGILTSVALVELIPPRLARLLAAPYASTRVLALSTIAIVLYGTLTAAGLTYADLQDAHGEADDRILFGKRNSVNQLLVRAGDQPDLCGMLVLGLMPNELFSGGTTYLHRDVLLNSPQSRALWGLMSKAANYAVAPDIAGPPGWRRIAQDKGVVLLKRPGECVSLPAELRPTYARPQTSAKN
jgi:GPI mannosyltransferase 3